MRATYSPSIFGTHHIFSRQGLSSFSARRRRTVSRETLSCSVRRTIADDSVVGIEPRASVKLDTAGAIVKLDPNAKIDVTRSETFIPRPTPEQLKSEAAPSSKAAVVTNYTVFKTVQYKDGQVITGWTFASNEETAPNAQYCYYLHTL